MMMAVWKFAPAVAAGQHRRVEARSHHSGDHVPARRGGRRIPASGGVQRACAGTTARRDVLLSLIRSRSMVSITGSVRAGREVAIAAAADIKRVHLELGGKAPVVVFDDADPAKAAEGIAMAGYFNAGQDCTAATRVLAGPRIHDDFRRRTRGTGQGPDRGGSRQ